VRPEGFLCKLKKFTSPVLENATFRLVAQCLNHYAADDGSISLTAYAGSEQLRPNELGSRLSFVLNPG
jgi:hypothetical protein